MVDGILGGWRLSNIFLIQSGPYETPYFNSGDPSVVGPGTFNLSTALGKSFAITERMRFKIEGSFTNVLNHVNLADPQMAIDAPSFGQITSARGSDFGGYRTGQVSARLEF